MTLKLVSSRSTPAAPPIAIDGEVLMWVPIVQLREKIFTWQALNTASPDAMCEVLSIVAQNVLSQASQLTDAEARVRGWVDVKAMYERGVEMQALLREFGFDPHRAVGRTRPLNAQLDVVR